MSSLDTRSNEATRINGYTVNGATADNAITVRGSDWYWAVCALMIFASLGFLALGAMRPRTHRVFHYITAGVTMVAAIAYFSMASNLGFTPIQIQFQRSDPKVGGQLRQIFYVRYIDWVITTPLLLLDLLLTAGMPWPSILWIILLDEIMIITGLVGALVSSSYKWGYFAFGCAALAYIVYELVWTARLHAKHLGNDVGRVFLMTGSLTTLLWILYPVAWGLAEGGNVISSDSEAIFYGILDVLAKPVFGAILIFGHKNIDPARLGLRIRDYDEDPAVTGSSVGHNEKHAPGATNGQETVLGTSNGATNGATNGHGVAGTADTHV
jgi:bacteriorhodopsin